MNLQALQAKRAEIAAQQEALVCNLNYINGYLKCLDDQIAELTAKPAEPETKVKAESKPK